MTYVNPGGEYVRIHGLPSGVEDVLRYADFLRQEAGLTDNPPIDLNRIYERFGIPKPRRADLPNQQGLLLNPESGLIIINQNDIGTRQRFTEAHELMELVFSQMPGGIPGPLEITASSKGPRRKPCATLAQPNC